jgi:hypothetical protein
MGLSKGGHHSGERLRLESSGLRDRGFQSIRRNAKPQDRRMRRRGDAWDAWDAWDARYDMCFKGQRDLRWRMTRDTNGGG